MCTVCSAIRHPVVPCEYQGIVSAEEITEVADAADGISTTYGISVGDRFTGVLDDSSDVDWISVSLEKGIVYDIAVNGASDLTDMLSDPVMKIYGAAGNYLAENDDGGKGTNSFLAFEATATGTYYISVQGYSGATGGYEVLVDAQAGESQALPGAAPITADLDTLADYLIEGYWNDDGGTPHHFDTSASNIITVNLDGLTTDGQKLARWALETWEAVADLDFVETAGSAQITFDDEDDGAYATYSALGDATSFAEVNVGQDWVNEYGATMGTYAFQTFIHEIGHALGLGHLGDYNGDATYGNNNTFANDSWQVSVMSYFDQDENTETDASYATLISAMAADIVAVQELYGAATTGSISDGDTVYGVGHTLGDSWLGQIFDVMNGNPNDSVFEDTYVAFTIYDANGRDRINFSNDYFDQVVDLNPESVSDVLGSTGNMYIARGTLIEEYDAGNGDDIVDGNAANNVIRGNWGSDTLRGGDGKDKLFGGDGDDILEGGAGNDKLNGGSGSDRLDGGDGKDTAIYLGESSGITLDLQDSDLNDGAALGDVLIDIERIIGTAHNDTVWGDTNDNLFKGKKGNDTFYGRDGDDKLLGNAGKDYLDGGAGNDILKGGNRKDTLIGGEGDDRLIGNGGSDTLSGGSGNDTLTGGRGKDTFIFSGGMDVITDFANDLLCFDESLWSRSAPDTWDVLALASVSGSDTVFSIDQDNSLTLQNFTDVDSLWDVLTIV